MSDEKIEVEWIATAQQMLATIQKIDSKLGGVYLTRFWCEFYFRKMG
jgi:hypothetical protein